MPRSTVGITNIGLVGGNELCREVLQKTIFTFDDTASAGPVWAVADPNPESPGITLANQMGLVTVSDYRDFYAPDLQVQLIIILNPDPDLFNAVLESRPPHIRLLSYPVFTMFWEAIGRSATALEAHSHALEAIINGIQEGILVILPDRTIEDVNDAFLSRMGFDREAVIGRKCHEIFEQVSHECDGPEFACPLRSVIRDQRPAQGIRSRTDRRGNPRHIEVSVYPTWEKDGKIAKFIHITRDITQRVEEEAELTGRLEHLVAERTHELEQTHAQLRHQDKMASMGKLSASVVHEINNPIAGILNLVLLMKRILGDGAPSADELASFSQYLTLMETETRRISRIVSNLLTFARQSPMEIRAVALNDLIEHTLVLNANLLKLGDVQISRHLEPGLPMVSGSADQLQQVIMNLVSNAVEAMENQGGGTLTISTTLKNGMVSATFDDTGPGIAASDRPRLFEPFFTTKTSGKGVGLGLSVAYGIIQEHRGHIRVAAGTKGGTRFVIDLPPHESEP